MPFVERCRSDLIESTFADWIAELLPVGLVRMTVLKEAMPLHIVPDEEQATARRLHSKW